jgi:hypothetical protein
MGDPCRMDLGEGAAVPGRAGVGGAPDVPATAAALAPAWQRLASLATLAVVGIFIALSLRGIDSTFLWGHDGYHGGAYGVRARHTLRSGTLLADETPGWAAPTGRNTYLHEPVLGHYVALIGIATLGDREAGVRSGYLAVTLLSLALVLALAARRDGPRGRLVAALAFVALPCTYRVASLADCGMAGLAALLASLLLYQRWLETGRLRAGLLAAALLALACGFEWSPFFGAVPLAAHAAWSAWRRRGSSIAVAWGLVAAPILAGLFHAMLVLRTGHLAEVLESYRVRDHHVAASRWLQLEAIAWDESGPAYRAALVVWIVTLAVRVRDRTVGPWLLAPASLLFALVTYVLVFTSGLLIHPQRLLYLVAIVPLVVVDVVAAAAAHWPDQPRLAWAVAGVYLGVNLPSAAERWREGRVPLALAGFDRVAVVASVRAATSPGDVVEIHRSASCVHTRQELSWHLDRDVETNATIPTPADAPERSGVLVVAPAALNPIERARWEQLGTRHPVQALGTLAWIDLRTTGPSPSCVLRFDRSSSLVGRWLQGPWGRPFMVCTPPGP